MKKNRRVTRMRNHSFDVLAGSLEREALRVKSSSRSYPARKPNCLFDLTPGQIADAFTTKEAEGYQSIIEMYLISGERISDADLAEIEEFISDHQSRGLEAVSKLDTVVTQIKNGE